MTGIYVEALILIRVWKDLGRWGSFTSDNTGTHIYSQGTWQFMSTRLLTNPGSQHTITDDLESHFFVLMWAALHWVSHSQPGRVPMEHIFDQQWPSLDGSEVIMGGAGKVLMYGSKGFLCQVELACKPFNELFWDLWMLFADYFEHRERAGRKGHPGEQPRHNLK